MEYVNQRGAFDDVPLARIVADFEATYPAAAPRRPAAADQLQPHRPAAVGIEACRHADRRQAGEGGVQRDLHPAVVGVHRAAGHAARPALRDGEGPDLRHRQRQHVEALEQAQQVLQKALRTSLAWP
jgi:hypothetical protein